MVSKEVNQGKLSGLKWPEMLLQSPNYVMLMM